MRTVTLELPDDAASFLERMSPDDVERLLDRARADAIEAAFRRLEEVQPPVTPEESERFLEKSYEIL